MALDIATFSNRTGGETVFKALGHPVTAEKLVGLIARVAARGPVALYDPHGLARTLAALHDLSALTVADVFVQRLEDIGTPVLGRTTVPVTEIAGSDAPTVLVIAFDAHRLITQIRHLLPAAMTVESLDAARLPDTLLSRPKAYLDKLNWATNLGFLRDGDGRHTRIVTANYWGSYGAESPRMWLRLFDADGATLATWEQPLGGPMASVVIDSAEVRARFDLPAFAGSLFMHVVGAAGHDVVKYAVDTYGDEPTELSCTHDANAWPADLYAGLPAPNPGERVTLWLQNAHPCPIPAGALGLNRMGAAPVVPIDRAIPAFGCTEVDLAELLPGLAWPEQVELVAGKHVVRPRYEVRAANGRNRIAHVNVERTDLTPDPGIAAFGDRLGKGFILPAPILPPDRFESELLPTPMSTAQQRLPLTAIVYDPDGVELARHGFGVLDRDHAAMLDTGALLRSSNRSAPSRWGHVELVYDFADGGEDAADGWLHALFRYTDRETGHAADTSFGAHVFNTVLTYKNEPQSYSGPAPGLSTRLFLRVGDRGPRPRPLETLCHLIYPASTPWHAASETMLSLHDAGGTEIARETVAIACGGSLLWRPSEVFAGADLSRAGDGAYVVIRDTTCRLFGYHGLEHPGSAFSLDHMFGF